MSEYRETRTVFEDGPIKRARPVVETQHDSVIHEHRGMSGAEVAALVLAAIAVGVVVTMLIMNNQRNSDEELAQERARTAAAEQAAAQQQPQQPPVVVMPQTQPGVAPVPIPPQPVPTTPATTTPTSTELELGVTSKLMEDQELRSYPIDVKVIGGTAMLSGRVPSEELKIQAEKLARTVKGVRTVVNTIVVKPD